jgi:splicing factor 3A subunit 1
MKLAAMFVAKNGREFMQSLAQREQRNYQFDFLRPTHSLYPVFTAYVEQYQKVLRPSQDAMAALEARMGDKHKTLERVMGRVRYAAYKEAEKKKVRDKEDKERAMWLSIDWHDFVVVETVEFNAADDRTELPPPITLTELESMSLAQKWTHAVVQPVPVFTGGDEMDMDEGDDDIILPTKSTAPIKIVKDKEKLKALKRQEPTQICPQCKMVFPVSEIEEHMRIELLDPRWRQQRESADSKQRSAVLAADATDTAMHLQNLAAYRSDLFGVEEVAIGKKVGQDEPTRRRTEPLWDGSAKTAPMIQQRRNLAFREEVKEQLRQHEQQHALFV